MESCTQLGLQGGIGHFQFLMYNTAQRNSLTQSYQSLLWVQFHLGGLSPTDGLVVSFISPGRSFLGWPAYSSPTGGVYFCQSFLPIYGTKQLRWNPVVVFLGHHARDIFCFASPSCLPWGLVRMDPFFGHGTSLP